MNQATQTPLAPPSDGAIDAADQHFKALKNAALLVPQYFGGISQVRAATCKSDLKPDFPLIRENLSLLTYDQEAYIIALLGFFDEHRAQAIGANASCSNIHYISRVMSPDQKVRIARILELPA